MSRRPALLLSLILAAALLAPLCSAHTLKVAGSIGILMHVDPDDDPAAGQPARLYLWVQSRKAQAACNCTVSIVDGGQSIYAAALNTGAPTPFTFPHAGVYQIAVSGKDDAGQPVSVTFDQRVEASPGAAAASSSPGGPDWVLYGIGGIVILAAIAGGIWLGRK